MDIEEHVVVYICSIGGVQRVIILKGSQFGEQKCRLEWENLEME